MTNELKEIFENVDQSILSEDVLAKIASLIKEKVDTRVSLEIENALQIMDEDHAEGFKVTINSLNENFELHKKTFPNVIKAIDTDHLGKVKQVVESINKDHIKKLYIIKEKYETLLKKTVIEHRDSIVESVNQFLDFYIDQSIPAKQIEEAAKNTYNRNILSEARQVLGIDDKVIKTNLKEAVNDAKNQLDQLAKENRELKNKMVIAECNKILAEKTAHLPTDVAKFVRARLANKSPQTILENFDYIVNMYERKESKDIRSSINESRTNNVDRNKVADELTNNTKVVSENTKIVSEPFMNIYLEGMNIRK